MFRRKQGNLVQHAIIWQSIFGNLEPSILHSIVCKSSLVRWICHILHLHWNSLSYWGQKHYPSYFFVFFFFWAFLFRLINTSIQIFKVVHIQEHYNDNEYKYFILFLFIFMNNIYQIWLKICMCIILSCVCVIHTRIHTKANWEYCEWWKL